MPRRWLIRGLFVLPILLCVSAWVWSMLHQTYSSYHHGGHEISCTMEGGFLDCYVLFQGQGPRAPDGWYCLTRSMDLRVVDPHFFPVRGGQTTPECTSSPRFLGFGYEHGTTSNEYRSVFVPYWFLIVVFSAALFVVCRKTRPKINPKMAFPVEVGEKHG
jgi:hypothetical protein